MLTRRGARLMLGLGVALVGLYFLAWMWGCTSGTDALGRTVVGVPLGIDPEADGAGLRASGGVIGGLIGGPAGATVGTAIGGLVATALGGWGVAQARARRRAENDRAALEGKEAGWDERERAAAVQAPLPGPADPGRVPAGGVRSEAAEVVN
jgi:hypothetical protein